MNNLIVSRSQRRSARLGNWQRAGACEKKREKKKRARVDGDQLGAADDVSENVRVRKKKGFMRIRTVSLRE
ncbi:Uncharacterized protein DAT39_023063 [Clarias magur]|uniref:Uncharacterized protein n=1 Tax=Clarias magur TaxID=1594786 RepID=A0A8J4U062_CLAMG|nr:Uncharacterized protein DAT39_023063 [Clarias magur]